MPIIVADESVDDPIVRAMRHEGWAVWSVSEECPSVEDEIVLDAAVTRNAILLTMDSDFGELVFDRGEKPPIAVIFVRNKGLTLSRTIKQVLAALKHGDLSGQFITLSRNAKRSRPLPNWKSLK